MRGGGIGGIKGGGIGRVKSRGTVALLVGILTTFEPLFWLICGIFEVADGDFTIGVRTGALTVEPGLSRMFTLSVPVCPKLSVTVS